MASRITYGKVYETTPEWAAHPIEPKDLIPAGGKLDWSTVPAQGEQFYVTFDVAPADGVASVIPNPLPANSIPKGTVFVGDGAETNTFTVREDYKAGDSEILVEGLVNATDSTDFMGVADATALKTIPSGTLVAQKVAGEHGEYIFVDMANYPEGSLVYLVPFSRTENQDAGDLELLRPNFLVKENYLPHNLTYFDYQGGSYSSWVSAMVNQRYQTTVGYN